MQDCLFCKIASGEIPSKKIYENDHVVAFLDINPSAPGHTLVVPKRHYNNILDVDEKTLVHLIDGVQTVAKRMSEKLGSDITVLQNNGRTSGQIVFHIHFHIIPRTEGDGIHFVHHRIQVSEQELDEMKNKLEKPSHASSSFSGW
jgi:histidine triad (HIT) family protein